MLVLSSGPDLPDHVEVDDHGIAYANNVRSDQVPLASCFSGRARPDEPDGPPWATLIFGLETGRFDMRQRFLAALQEDAKQGRSLERYAVPIHSGTIRTTRSRLRVGLCSSK